MPKQEVFFEQEIGHKRVEVLKSYDQSYARAVFDTKDEEARKHLWDALKPEENYDPEGLPKLNDPDDVNDEAGLFLWDELLEQATEDACASRACHHSLPSTRPLGGAVKTSSSHRIGLQRRPWQEIALDQASAA